MTSGSPGNSTRSRPIGWGPRGLGLGLLLLVAALPAQQEAASQEATEAVEAALAAARAARSGDGLQAARGQLLSLGQRFPQSKHPQLTVRGRALVEAAALGRRTGNERQAAGELLRVLEREAESEWTPRAHFELGDLLLMQGHWQEAVDHLRLAREGSLRRAADGAEAATDRVAGSDVAAPALERMTLIHRLILRPLAGQERWLRSRSYMPGQVGIEKPRGVAAGPEGELLITDTNRAALLDAGGAPSSARDLRGIVRPSDTSRGALAVITADGVAELQGALTVSFARAQGGALDRIVAAHRDDFGNWTVLSRRTAEVLRYDADGRPLETIRVGAMTQPIDLAVGVDGAIHVLDAGSRSAPPAVLRFDAGGRFEEAFRADWRRPVAIDVDPLGNRYVLDAGALQVLVYDPAANPLATLGPSLPSSHELRTPEDIAVDNQARIFIADSRLGTVLVVE